MLPHRQTSATLPDLMARGSYSCLAPLTVSFTSTPRSRFLVAAPFSCGLPIRSSSLSSSGGSVSAFSDVSAFSCSTSHIEPPLHRKPLSGSSSCTTSPTTDCTLSTHPFTSRRSSVCRWRPCDIHSRQFLMRLFPNRTAPNHALQRTATAVTAPASGLRLSPTAQEPRQPPRSLSLRSLGVSSRLLKPHLDESRSGQYHVQHERNQLHRRP